MKRTAIVRLSAMPAVALALAGVLIALWSGPADAATTFTVNRTGDAGDRDLADTVCDASGRSGNQCTLRAAIEESNDTLGADTINFNIGGRATVKTINVGSSGLGALPIMTDTVTINGYTQRRAKENTLAESNDAVLKIVLNGANAVQPGGASGLEIQTSNSTIKGLVINRFSAHGVIIRGSGATGNFIEGNFIGTNARGTADRGNTGAGVVISFAPNNTVGGTQPAQRNVISGNGDGFGGVHISAAGATGNKVEGNFIGTTANGTGDLGNGNAGVLIQSADNTVGGTDADDGTVDGVVKARNVISANNDGVKISGSGATGNQVMGNFIGTTADGSGDLGNDLDGVFIADALNNTIGGTTAGARNTISGNGDDGVLILNGAGLGDAEFNKVEGNRIGIEAEGNGALGNGGDGVIISSASNNTIGGTASGAGNAISNNGDDGVEISGSGATGNSVLSNVIFSNGGTIAANLGIDLFPDGVTANDDKDLDTGANNLQNFPVITSAIRSNLTNFTTISGTINSNTFQDFTIQCFVADTTSTTSNGEGFIPAGADTTVTTDANGDDGFSCVSPVPQVTQAVTATATNETTGDTSEFALNVGVVAGP